MLTLGETFCWCHIALSSNRTTGHQCAWNTYFGISFRYLPIYLALEDCIHKGFIEDYFIHALNFLLSLHLLFNIIIQYLLNSSRIFCLSTIPCCWLALFTWILPFCLICLENKQTKMTNTKEGWTLIMDQEWGFFCFVLCCFSFLAYCLSGLHANLLVYSQMYANLVI